MTTLEDYLVFRARLSVKQSTVAAELLTELTNESKEWPHAAELASRLTLMLDRALPKTNCLILWTDIAGRQFEAWSVQLDTDEIRLMHDIKDQELHDDDERVHEIGDILAARGVKLEGWTEGAYLVMKVVVV